MIDEHGDPTPAAAGALPVIFFCQNNQLAISTRTGTQMRTPLYVHAVTRHATERVRAGAGTPILNPGSRVLAMVGRLLTDPRESFLLA